MVIGKVGARRTSTELPKRVQKQPEVPQVRTPPADTHVGSVVVPSVDLEVGAKGAEVKKLQRLLVKLGCLASSEYHTSPGTFGPRTEAAVKRFQSSHDVPPTGFYGPMTRAALAKALG